MDVTNSGTNFSWDCELQVWAKDVQMSVFVLLQAGSTYFPNVPVFYNFSVL